MAHYIRIDNKEDLDWMSRVLDNLLSRDPNNPQLQINYNYILNWRKYIENTVSAKEVSLVTEAPEIILSEGDKRKMAPRPSRTKAAVSKKKKKTPASKSSIKQTKVAPDDIYTCVDHPTYGARRRPRTDCDRCWELFGKFNPPAVVKQKRNEFDRLNRSNTAP
jgi:hypothetical protein